MTIDIIDLTDPEYANLSAVQMAMVRAAQGKKNALVADAEKEKEDLYDLLVSNNFARSSVFEKAQARIDAQTEEKVAVVKDDLLYQLAFEGLSSDGNEQGPYRYPENPNYNLAPPQRFLVVRSYYMGLDADAQSRLAAYSMDTLAMSYLGEYYATLYDLLASYCD